MQAPWAWDFLAVVIPLLSLCFLATPPPCHALSTGASTVGPGYSRASGKLSATCPSTHPYSYHQGAKCCSRFIRASGCTQGSGGKLQFEDDSNCCQPADAVDCPTVSQNICTSLDVEVSPCPPGHGPLALGSKCCPQYKRSSACPTIGGGGGVELGDPVECCDGAPIDCPSLPLPCGRPESRCYHKSEASMSHAEADSYCEDNNMTKIEFKNMAVVKTILDSVANGADDIYAWTSLTPYTHHSHMGTCQKAGCDGLFYLNDGSTMYSYAETGIDLFFIANPHSGCIATNKPNGEYILWEAGACWWNSRAVCLCSA